MKKFITKSAYFVFPFFLSFLMFLSLGTVKKGDLTRIGLLVDKTSNYRAKLNANVPKVFYYQKLSQLQNQKKFDILTIGDSFSKQEKAGYQTYLATDGNLNVLFYDGVNSNGNPLETLYGVINGDILDSIKVKYVLLQSVERDFSERASSIEKQKIITLNHFKENQISPPFKAKPARLFSRITLLFPLNNLLYLFDDRAFFAPVIKARLDKNLFSIGDHELLYFEDDIISLKSNNNEKRVKELNDELNSIAALLAKKGVKLIVLPGPDKYGVYYENIIGKENFPKPMFFEYMGKQQKNYIYINSKIVLSNATKSLLDVYYYDDTHWSPIGARLIAKEVLNEINNSSK